MSELKVIPVQTESDLKKFIHFPWKIYKNDKNWVPPLIGDLKKLLKPSHDGLGAKICHETFLALIGDEPVGRIFAGYDKTLNAKKNIKLGYFALFECINDEATAQALFDAAIGWFRGNGIESVIGPTSPTGTDGDENKGLLVDCFDRPPVLMNSYNPPYYRELIEKCGFVKDYDVFAYYLDKDSLFTKNPGKIIEYAQKRYGFHVDTLNKANIEKDLKDMKHVMDLAMPDDWPDLVPPTMEEMWELADKLMPNADPDLIIIARSGDEAVGFGIALPDYNQALIHMNGRMNPISIIKFLWYKRKIDWARFFVMFVIPAYRSKGVSHAIYYKTFVNGVNKGMKYGEGSTIGETNIRMRTDIESVGGQKYKTYRIFKKELEQVSTTLKIPI